MAISTHIAHSQSTEKCHAAMAEVHACKKEVASKALENMHRDKTNDKEGKYFILV